MLKFRFEGNLTHRVPEVGLDERGPGGILGKAGEIVAWGRKPPVASPPTSSSRGSGHTTHRYLLPVFSEAGLWTIL